MLIKLIGESLSSHENRRLERIWKIAHIDFKTRYYDSFLGLIWALLNPVFRISIYFFVFTYFMKIGSIDNYALYLFSGLIIWIYFVETTKKELTLFNAKKYLLESIQIRMEDLFYSSTISTTLGLMFNLVAYLIIAALAGISFGYSLLLLPVIIMTVFILSTGVGMILAVISIYFRDILNFWDLAILLGFWTCPIFFKGEAIFDNAPFLMYLNPMAGVIYNIRPMILTNSQPDYFLLFFDLAYAILILIIGRLLLQKHANKALELI